MYQPGDTRYSEKAFPTSQSSQSGSISTTKMDLIPTPIDGLGGARSRGAVACDTLFFTLGRLVPSIVEPDHASVITRGVYYAKATLDSCTRGRLVATDGAASAGPTRSRCQSASCPSEPVASWTVLASWTLVQSPPLPSRPLGLLVNENRKSPAVQTAGTAGLLSATLPPFE